MDILSMFRQNIIRKLILVASRTGLLVTPPLVVAAVIKYIYLGHRLMIT